jgi:hypothetical protein
MDQMPLHFSYHSSKTLEKCGAKTIRVRKTGNGTKRATVVFTITAVSNIFTPMIIHKGKPHGHITKKELPNFDPTSIYACQEAMWIDEQCMLLWLTRSLACTLW